MTLADDFLALATEFATGEFGSTITWRRKTYTETLPGEYSVVDEPHTFRACVVDPRDRSLGEFNVEGATTAIMVGAAQIPWDPNATTGEREVQQLDEVSIQSDKWLRVLRVHTYFGPGEANPAVPVAHLVFLGS